MKSRNQLPVTLPDDANSISIRFYISDSLSSPPNVPRLELHFPGSSVSFDRPLSDYSSLTPAQKVTLRSMLTSLRDETFVLEGFV